MVFYVLIERHKPVLGKYEQVQTIETSGPAPNFLVLSEKNSLSLLNGMNSSVIWRKIFPYELLNVQVHAFSNQIVSFGKTEKETIIAVFDFNGNLNQRKLFKLSSTSGVVLQESEKLIVSFGKQVCDLIDDVCSTLTSIQYPKILVKSSDEDLLVIGTNEKNQLYKEKYSVSLQSKSNELLGTVDDKLGGVFYASNFIFWVSSGRVYFKNAQNLKENYFSSSAKGIKYLTSSHLVIDNEKEQTLYEYSTKDSSLKKIAHGKSIVLDLNDLSNFYLIENGSIMNLQSKTNLKVPCQLDTVFIHSKYSLVQCHDLETILFEESNKIWERDEFMAKIEKVETLDLPEYNLLKDHFIASQSNSIFQNFVERVKFHLTSLKKSFFSFFNSEENMIPSSLVRDRFGFKKLFVVATRRGKIAAFLSENFKPVWKQRFDGNVIDLKTIRTVFSGKSSLIGLILQKDSRYELLVLDGLTGEVVETKKVKLDFWKVLTIPDEKKHQFSFALISKDLKVQILMETERLSFPYYFADQQNDKLKCYYLDRESAHLVWEHQLHGSPVASTIESSIGVYASIGKILPDRSVLFKYLNPNLKIIINANGHQLFVYLIDIITGRIIKKMVHDDYTGGEVQLVQDENFFVYQYLAKVIRERKSNKFDVLPKISVVELFESELVDQKLLSLQNQSSFDNIEPFLKQETFLNFKHSVAFGISSTQNGISTKEIYLATNDFQIHSISRKLLSAFRPHKPANSLTAEEKEEGIIAYNPLIEENSKEIITHGRQVYGIKKIMCYPTSLESTTLLFALGHDLYMARKAPSKTFDVLGDDFSRVGLSLVILALISGIYVAKYLAQRKQLNLIWK